ncbi:nuclear transcription factor Y subunit B-like isoform X2 [Zingiber officinale]|uniref:nuclear transcription factor Y subunit B-like isoform X2 n=1 Tax=Zingiber officinale TaxID=94328 RepID=UPI001C4D7035|nr:nuclear transcription factor Y subunit B-like isoform X2 [Zingiber officinale]
MNSSVLLKKNGHKGIVRYSLRQKKHRDCGRGKKAENLCLLDMEKRQKQRVEEIRESQRKDEQTIPLKGLSRAEVRKELDKMEWRYRDMASLLRGTRHLPCHTRVVGELSSPKEQDRFLPITNVSRIIKKALPASAKISKDAKEMVQECISEFIIFITGEASDKCQCEKRKTINGDDLLWAMTTLGFEEYVEPLKV